MTDENIYINLKNTFVSPKEFIKNSDGKFMKMIGATVTDNEPFGNYGADLTHLITADTIATGRIALPMPHTEAKK
jgi:hypothetical protein